MKQPRANELYPQFIWFGKTDTNKGTAMRLDGNQYWRDGGLWGTDFKFEEGKLISCNHSRKTFDYLNNQVLSFCTYDEWKKDNGQYAIKVTLTKLQRFMENTNGAFSKQPQSLDEAVNLILEDIKNDPDNKKFIEVQDEDRFTSRLHFNVGMNMRNKWNLWWSEELAKQYPKTMPETIPPIVKYFNDNGVTHADHISDTILTIVYRRYKGHEENIEKEFEKHREFEAQWKNKKLT